jgi:hypothetical protein
MALRAKLREWSGMLLACFLVVAVLTPTIDIFACVSDPGATVVSEQGTSSHLDAGKPTHDESDSACMHGHCHHWAGFTKLAERASLEGAGLTSLDAPTGSYRPHPSAPQIQLLRPPRA